MNHNELSAEDFNYLVSFFAWLKMVRDQKSTRVDGIEPLNELISHADEIQDKVLE
jgi:hypothetical protein